MFASACATYVHLFYSAFGGRPPSSQRSSAGGGISGGERRGKKEAKFFPSLHATKRGEGVHQMFSVLILLFSSSSSPRCMRELFPEEGTKTKADGKGTEIRAV